jgi:hypothetical protein
MSARVWTHAGVSYRMPPYRASLDLTKRAATLNRDGGIEAQVENLPLYLAMIAACLHDPALTLPADPDEVEGALMDAGWTLIDIITAATACMREMNDRLYKVSDGAVKARDFSSPRTEPSTTS